MHEETEKTVKKIVENLNDVTKKSKSKKGADYLKDGLSMVNVNIPAASEDVEEKIGKYIRKQTKEINAGSKKIKVPTK